MIYIEHADVSMTVIVATFVLCFGLTAVATGGYVKESWLHCWRGIGR
jgi:hypothetical protein